MLMNANEAADLGLRVLSVQVEKMNRLRENGRVFFENCSKFLPISARHY